MKGFYLEHLLAIAEEVDIFKTHYPDAPIYVELHRSRGEFAGLNLSAKTLDSQGESTRARRHIPKDKLNLPFAFSDFDFVVPLSPHER